jgi:hypothetical protein
MAALAQREYHIERKLRDITRFYQIARSRRTHPVLNLSSTFSADAELLMRPLEGLLVVAMETAVAAPFCTLRCSGRRSVIRWSALRAIFPAL